MASAEDVTLSDWTKFKFMAFDVPKHPGTYEERYQALGNLSLQLSLSHACLHSRCTRQAGV